jgi:sugar phosphate isomerase/epimerase
MTGSLRWGEEEIIDVARTPPVRVALSTASVYPESTADAFEIGSRLGYDGIEVMVWTDPVSQDAALLRRLEDRWEIPVVAVHAPCLLVTQRVWTIDPWVKLRRSVDMAERLGADVVVVHPPFRWQREYARQFLPGIEELTNGSAVRVAVENMYPLRTAGRSITAYAPHWDLTRLHPRHATLDVSHAGVALQDSPTLAAMLGDRLTHVHLADSLGTGKDEHLIPGRGKQRCAELLVDLGHKGFSGHVCVEVNTRRALTRADREGDLEEALAFARLHLKAGRTGATVAAAPEPRTMTP